MSKTDVLTMDPDESEMDIVYEPDRGGNTIKFEMFEGKHYIPFFKPRDLQGIKHLDLRDDDIYLATYLRTGTHWAFEMISMLLNGTADTITKTKMRHQIEIASAEDVKLLPSPRVLNAHTRVSDGPTQLPEKKCKIIYNLRDPKDVVVSLFNFYHAYPMIFEYKGEFKDFLYLFMDGRVDMDGYFGHLRDAEKYFDDNPDIPVYIHVYEDAIQDPVTAVQKLSDFLGLERNDNLCKTIAAKCSFSTMKKDKMPYTLRYNNTEALYRKGIVGDWKNWFTDEMLEDYYRVYEEKMAGSRFYERYAKNTVH